MMVPCVIVLFRSDVWNGNAGRATPDKNSLEPLSSVTENQVIQRKYSWQFRREATPDITAIILPFDELYAMEGVRR
jgi:hypothetical protein